VISNRWKILAAALTIIGTLATAQPQPGGLGGFFQAVYGGSKVSIFPDDVADLAGWWDASDADTISLVAGTNRVSEWRDKSGLDRHFTQTDANERPYYDVVQNGLDAIRTAGAEGMNYNTLDNTVWRFLHEGNASLLIAFEIIGPQPNNEFGLVLDTAGLTQTGFFIFYDNRQTQLGRTNYFRINSGNVSTPNYSFIENNYITQDNPTIVATISDASNATAAERLFVYNADNVRVNPDNTDAGSVTGNTARDLSFGQEAAGAFDLDIKIFELIIYSNKITETERTGLIDYLATKWGI
jgi:hypothetical protein